MLPQPNRYGTNQNDNLRFLIRRYLVIVELDEGGVNPTVCSGSNLG
jgi:hypothetical protein